MSDAELRGRLLKHFYGLRHSNSGVVPVSNEILSGGEPINDHVIRSICGHLATAGLIEWTPYLSGVTIGQARITAYGVDAVELTRDPGINICFHDTATAPTAVAIPAPAPTVVSALAAVSPVDLPKGEMFTLKPSLWGFSVDLKEVFRWFHRKRRRQE